MNRNETGKLLKDPSRAGVYCSPRKNMNELLASAQACGFAIRRIDLAAALGKNALMTSMANALDFPDWFGHNWDALADCLGDLSWLPAEGYLLVLEGAETFRRRHAEEFAAALQVLAGAADVWREADVPFWVLADSKTETLPRFPGDE